MCYYYCRRRRFFFSSLPFLLHVVINTLLSPAVEPKTACVRTRPVQPYTRSVVNSDVILCHIYTYYVYYVVPYCLAAIGMSRENPSSARVTSTRVYVVHPVVVIRGRRYGLKYDRDRETETLGRARVPTAVVRGRYI